jgi:hypothetical protein
MSLEHSPARDGKDKKALDLDPSLDPSWTVSQFCELENISKQFFYGMSDKPDGYFAGDSYRIPQSSRLAWRARRMVAAPEIAARQAEAARVRRARTAAAKQEA